MEMLLTHICHVSCVLDCASQNSQRSLEFYSFISPCLFWQLIGVSFLISFWKFHHSLNRILLQLREWSNLINLEWSQECFPLAPNEKNHWKEQMIGAKSQQDQRTNQPTHTIYQSTSYKSNASLQKLLLSISWRWGAKHPHPSNHVQAIPPTTDLIMRTTTQHDASQRIRGGLDSQFPKIARRRQQNGTPESS